MQRTYEALAINVKAMSFRSNTSKPDCHFCRLEILSKTEAFGKVEEAPRIYVNKVPSLAKQL